MLVELSSFPLLAEVEHGWHPSGLQMATHTCQIPPFPDTQEQGLASCSCPVPGMPCSLFLSVFPLFSRCHGNHGWIGRAEAQPEVWCPMHWVVLMEDRSFAYAVHLAGVFGQNLIYAGELDQTDAQSHVNIHLAGVKRQCGIRTDSKLVFYRQVLGSV